MIIIVVVFFSSVSNLSLVVCRSPTCSPYPNSTPLQCLLTDYPLSPITPNTMFALYIFLLSALSLLSSLIRATCIPHRISTLRSRSRTNFLPHGLGIYSILFSSSPFYISACVIVRSCVSVSFVRSLFTLLKIHSGRFSGNKYAFRFQT